MTAFPSSRSREKIDGADDGIDREGVDFQPEWFQDRLTLCHERRNEKQSVRDHEMLENQLPEKQRIHEGGAKSILGHTLKEKTAPKTQNVRREIRQSETRKAREEKERIRIQGGLSGGGIFARIRFGELRADPSYAAADADEDDGIASERLLIRRFQTKSVVSRSRKQARARPGKKAVRFGITRQVTEVSEEGGIAEGFRGRSKLARFHRHRADPETERPVQPIRPAPGSGLLPHRNSSGASLCGSLRD